LIPDENSNVCEVPGVFSPQRTQRTQRFFIDYGLLSKNFMLPRVIKEIHAKPQRFAKQLRGEGMKGRTGEEVSLCSLPRVSALTPCTG
jgi:hypothetical protein